MSEATWASGKNILLVEDDQAVRQSIKLLLNIDRHTVTEAANGQQAMELFADSNYDLVITDYLMPEMLGDELAQNLKNLMPSQRILMVTAHVEKLADAGRPADSVLAKPFGLDELRQAVARPIDGPPRTNAAASSLPGTPSPSASGPRVSSGPCVLEESVRSNPNPLVVGAPSAPEPTVPAPEITPRDAREHVDPGTLTLWVQEQTETLESGHSSAAGLLQLLTFAHACNVLASDEIRAACGADPAFRYLCHGSAPFTPEITVFRRRHRPQLELALAQTLAKVATRGADRTSDCAWTKYVEIAQQRLDVARHLDTLG